MWRIELGAFSYVIKYRSGNENVAQDAFSRVCAGVPLRSSLADVHEYVCHPGVTRLMKFVLSKNLPFSFSDVKQVCSQCRERAEIKPQFKRLESGVLIKAPQPWERFSIDFKGPVKSSHNLFLLVVADEFSRFPFVFPCRDVSAKTVIACLSQLFCICGLPGFVQSDQDSAFMSRDEKTFLHSRGVVTSRLKNGNTTDSGFYNTSRAVFRCQAKFLTCCFPQLFFFSE